MLYAVCLIYVAAKALRPTKVQAVKPTDAYLVREGVIYIDEDDAGAY